MAEVRDRHVLGPLCVRGAKFTQAPCSVRRGRASVAGIAMATRQWQFYHAGLAKGLRMDEANEYFASLPVQSDESV